MCRPCSLAWQSIRKSWGKSKADESRADGAQSTVSAAFYCSDAKVDVKPLDRNIDRILSTPSPSTSGILTYKEHGLLLCEVHILRQKALQVLPREIKVEFLEELNDLVDLRTGIERQLRVVDRIRWAYGQWLSQ